MPNYYAQVDKEGKVFSLAELSGEIHMDELIPITRELFENSNLLGSRYKDGDFVGYYASLEADQTSVSANGTDTITITVRMLNWRNVPQPDYKQELVVEVNGMKQTVALKKGLAELTISSEEPGEFVLRTVNMDRNSEIKVVFTDGV